MKSSKIFHICVNKMAKKDSDHCKRFFAVIYVINFVTDYKLPIGLKNLKIYFYKAGRSEYKNKAGLVWIKFELILL